MFERESNDSNDSLFRLIIYSMVGAGGFGPYGRRSSLRDLPSLTDAGLSAKGGPASGWRLTAIPR